MARARRHLKDSSGEHVHRLLMLVFNSPCPWNPENYQQFKARNSVLFETEFFLNVTFTSLMINTHRMMINGVSREAFGAISWK